MNVYEDLIDHMARPRLERNERWREINMEIPALHFKEEWEVKIITPFGGAVARFLIDKDGEEFCSVYLDWYSALGGMGFLKTPIPYWEVFVFTEESPMRFSLENVEDMMEYIDTAYNAH